MPASSHSVALESAMKLVQTARDAIKVGDTSTAIVQADDALEIFLKHLCVTNGCDEKTTMKDGNGKDRPFPKWGFTDYMQYLDSHSMLSKNEKSDFFTFHQWRNLVHHHGVEMKETQAKLVVDRVEEFISKKREEPSTKPAEKILEEEDIQPIIRSSPFLVEAGCKLEQGEKYLSPDSLAQIDLALRDSKGVQLYVEVKWSSVDLSQVDNYKKLLKQAGPHRILWFIPSDLASWKDQVESKGVGVKLYDRNSFSKMALIRREAKAKLRQIQTSLSSPFEATIYGDKIKFSDVIKACYFQGNVKTDKGERELGLKQTATGRQLDLIRCVSASSYSSSLPELTILLLRELIHAPFYYKSGRYLKISSSLVSAINEGYLHAAASIIEKLSRINLDVTEFYKEHYQSIKGFYLDDPRNSDLLLRAIQEYVSPPRTAASISVSEIISRMKKAFTLAPTAPPPSIRHSVLKVDIANVGRVDGFENDMARRVVEIATLKRILIPVSGLAQMWVLVSRKREGKTVYERVPCQNFTLNTDPNLYLGVGLP